MTKSTSGKPAARWLNVLRPLFWWLLLVLGLFGLRTHQELMEKTRLKFTVSMQGQVVETSTALDGKPAYSGQNISLGHHAFAVMSLKGEPYSTNFFIWYGEHNLGNIDLKRTMGTLAITVEPPAPLLIVRGPEWSVTLKNSSGLTKTVPTDQYVIESQYAHWGRAEDVTVSSGTTTTWRITPTLGALQLTCNQADAIFQLLTMDGRQMESGTFPSFIPELPEGNYKVVTVHHQHQLDQSVAVTAGATNDHPVEFMYGKAVLETEPASADVLDANGREYGRTPVTFTELAPGTLKFILHRAGYESVPVTLEITANQTTMFRTNLISAGYTEAMKSGRQYLDATDYVQALQAFNDALVAKPDDADARSQQLEAAGLGHLQTAKTLGKKGDYIAGERELAMAVLSLPNNEEIKTLLAEYKQREPAQIERERLVRLARTKKVFDDFVTRTPDAQLFESHEFKSTKPVRDVAAAIVEALQEVQPIFTVTVNTLPQPGTYAICANQKDTSVLGDLGSRQCLIVCGQGSDTETQIYFENMEYKAKHNLSAKDMVFKDEVSFVPIASSGASAMTDKMRDQIQAGVSKLTARIQGAIGQPPTAQPAVPQ